MDYPRIPGTQIQDLRGQKFGRLTALYPCCKYPKIGRCSTITWVCLCECEPDSQPVIRAGDLVQCATTSCGCLRSEVVRQTRIKHGLSNSKTYAAWCSMIYRCTNPSCKDWEHYGGRTGNPITVCDRWLNSFELFLKDMGERPQGMTLERNDVNGNYEPGNCRWATQQEQVNNTRRNKMIAYNGKTQSLANWCRELNVSYGRTRDRLKNGWNAKDAFECPLYSKKPQGNAV